MSEPTNLVMSLKQKVSSALFFQNTDDAVSSERVRNEEARAQLMQARITHAEQVREIEKEEARLNAGVKAKRAAYAKKAQPMLDEFNEIALAQHYYQEVGNSVSGQSTMVGSLHEQELHRYGYMSKKLISVSLNFEALRNSILSGRPFARELQAALDDADSDDMSLISAPLRHYAEEGLPTRVHVRSAAFDLARAIEETGRAPVQEPVRGWLDFFKFRSSFSPTAAELNQIRASRTSATFMRHVEKDEFSEALQVARDASRHVYMENDASKDFFDTSYRHFYSCAMPNVTAQAFLTYAEASLNASRFMCVEKLFMD